MLRKLLPREGNFFEFFEKHARTIVEGAKALLLFNNSNQDPSEVFKEIKKWEEEGDHITHQCVEALHKTFITPIDRGDIHHLISTMDDVLDEIEDVGRFIVLYKLKTISSEANQLANILVKCAEEMEKAIIELKKMKNTKAMQGHFFNINKLESDADTIFIDALKKLFNEEKDPITLIKWKEVYEHLEHATDACEDVANILEGIVLEYE